MLSCIFFVTIILGEDAKFDTGVEIFMKVNLRKHIRFKELQIQNVGFSRQYFVRILRTHPQSIFREGIALIVKVDFS